MSVDRDGVLDIDAYTQRGDDPDAEKTICQIDNIGIKMSEEEILQAQ